MRYLTKSRFKLAVECPTKLFYTGRDVEYANTKKDDDFLAALADGGFQVGELAKVMHPEGIEVRATGNADALRETSELLRRDQVTLFEAAIAVGPYLVRVDVLRKRGNEVDFIEVKAKSYSSTDPYVFKGKKGGWESTMLPYLQDVAFQRYVVGKAFPEWHVRSFLMLADTAKRCSVSGLNQRFRITRTSQGRQQVAVAAGTDLKAIGAPILTAEPVDTYVDEILAGALETPSVTGPFEQVIAHLAAAYETKRKLEPVIGPHCGRCEFRADDGDLRSGYHECWQDAAGFSRAEVDQGTVLDIWNYRGKAKLLQAGIRRMQDVREEHLKPKASEEGLTNGQRQWMQASGRWPGGGPFFLDRHLVRAEMATWEYPLHFIDFETARVAIPFYAGQAPYSNVAFQFSHHRVERDGRVEHANEYLSLERGASPNYEFTRRLRLAVGDRGTIFMWTSHENTTLRDILRHLEADPNPPDDLDDLRTFLIDVTAEKDGGEVVREGRRAMYDLCVLSRRAFFHPDTRASSSIKKVLPAVMASSEYLRQRYGTPVYGAPGGISSKNFTGWQWWRADGGAPVNPYSLLPPVFDDLPMEVLAALDVDDEMGISQGGAATTAWARIQFDETAGLQADRIASALKRYCELDTLAMVMVYEAWLHWL